jgi:hypothetical protein
VVDTDTFKAAVALKERILLENKCRDKLSAAIAARNFSALTASIAEAAEMGLNEELVTRAQALRAELEEHENALNELREATKERTLEAVQNALKRCKRVALPDGHAEVKAGKELEARLLEEKDTEDELNAAADAKDLARIEKALKKAEKAGMTDASAGVKKAAKMAERLKAEAEAWEGLKKAV